MENALPPDPHFGTDEEKLAWSEWEKLTPVKDAQGELGKDVGLDGS